MFKSGYTVLALVIVLGKAISFVIGRKGSPGGPGQEGVTSCHEGVIKVLLDVRKVLLVVRKVLLGVRKV